MDSTRTPEMTEEDKLRAKYGGALPRNMLTKKLLTKPKYFDSGDYNVAKAQGKLAANKFDSNTKLNPSNTPITGQEIPTPETVMPRKLSCIASITPTTTTTTTSSTQ